MLKLFKNKRSSLKDACNSLLLELDPKLKPFEYFKGWIKLSEISIFSPTWLRINQSAWRAKMDSKPHEDNDKKCKKRFTQPTVLVATEEARRPLTTLWSCLGISISCRVSSFGDESDYSKANLKSILVAFDELFWGINVSVNKSFGDIVRSGWIVPLIRNSPVSLL